MALELILDSLDSVGDDVKPFYVEHEGRFQLDVDKYAESKAKGIKSKNSDLIARLNKANEALKKFEPLSEFEPDDLQAMLEAHTNKTTNGEKITADTVKAEVEKATQKLVKKHGETTAALTTENDTLKKEIKHFKLTVPLRDAFLKASVRAESIDFALFDTSKNFKLDDDGKIIVLDTDGDPTDMTPAKFISDIWKPKNEVHFAASGAGGSGAPGATGTSSSTNAGKKTIKRAAFDQLNATDKAQKMKEGYRVIE